MAISLQALLWKEVLKVLRKDAEEHKMGIKGSSTVQLYFQDCKVPVENVLGEIGKGHIIAFNILNIGRLKLCAAALGGAKTGYYHNHSIRQHPRTV